MRVVTGSTSCTDSNDPLTLMVFRVTPGIIKVKACAETYIAGVTANWFHAIANVICKSKGQADAGCIAI